MLHGRVLVWLLLRHGLLLMVLLLRRLLSLSSEDVCTGIRIDVESSRDVVAVVVSRRHTGAPSILVPTVPCTAVTQEPAQSVQHIPSTSTLLVAVVPSVIPCQAKGVVEQGARSELLPTSTVIREHARSETRPRFSAWRKGGRTADLIGQESGDLEANVSRERIGVQTESGVLTPLILLLLCRTRLRGGSNGRFALSVPAGRSGWTSLRV